MSDQEDRQRTIDILVQATDQVAPGLDSAETQFEDFQKRMKKLREEDAKDAAKSADKGALGNLKATFGEDSKLGLALKTLQGAGAAAGLSIAGNMLNDMVQSAVKLREEFNAGAIGAGEMVEKLAASIPIYGQIIQAGRGIRELLTGEQAEANRINKEMEATVAYMTARLSLQRTLNSSTSEQVELIKKLRDENKLLSLPDGGAREAEKNRQANAGQFGEIISKRNAELADIEKKRVDGRTPDANQLGALDEKIREIRGRGLLGEQQGQGAELAKAQADAATLRDRIAKVDKDAKDAKAKARADANEANRQLIIKGQLEESEANRKFSEERLKEIKSFGQKTIEEEAKLRADRLKAIGQDYTAEIEQAKSALDKKRREIEADGEQARKALLPGDTRGLADLEGGLASRRATADEQYRAEVDKANLDRQKKASDAEKKAGEEAKQQRERDLTENERSVRGLVQTRIDALKAEGEAGNKVKAIEAERLEITEKFRHERAELNRILKDDEATEEQKALARAGLGDIGSREGRAQELVAIKNRKTLIGTATADTNSSLRGVVSGAREDAFLQSAKDPAAEDRKAQAKREEERRKLLDDQKTLLAQILAAVLPAPSANQLK